MARHVLLPFDLRDKNIDPLEGDALRVLRGIFPGTKAIIQGVGGSFLSFTVSELPKTPWPLTVGGLPITISDDKQGRGPLFPRQKLGNLSKSIYNDFDGRNAPLSDGYLRQLAAEIVKGLRDYLPRFTLVEIIFTLERTIYVLLNGVDTNATRLQLPGKIAPCPVGYVLKAELCRWQCAGVGAEDHIPGLDRLSGQRPGGKLARATKVYVDSASAGSVAGVVVAKSVKLEEGTPQPPADNALQYVVYDWVFTGQVEGAGDDRPRIPDDIFGSAVRDEDGLATGFVRYRIDQGSWAGLSCF